MTMIEMMVEEYGIMQVLAMQIVVLLGIGLVGFYMIKTVVTCFVDEFEVKEWFEKKFRKGGH